jgi:hypothetical protein
MTSEKVRRFLSGTIGLILLGVAVVNFTRVETFGITPAVFALISLSGAVLLLWRASGRSAGAIAPRSLQKWTFVWLGLYCAAVGVSVIGAIATGDIGVSELHWFIPLALLSWGVWGGAAYFVIGLPLWGLWRLVTATRQVEAKGDV